MQKLLSFSLANYPGFFAQGNIKGSGPVIVYWPALVHSKHIKELVHLENEVFEVSPTSELSLDEIYYQKETVDIASCPVDTLKEIPLGKILELDPVTKEVVQI